MKKVSQVNIFLGEEKERSEVADALRIIADSIENGYSSGIAGWSDVSWNLDFGEEEDSDDEEHEDES